MAVYKSSSIDSVMYRGQEISKIYVGTELFWPISEGQGGSDKPIIPSKEITSITLDSVAVDTLTWKGGEILFTYNYTFTFEDGTTSKNVLGATVTCNKTTIGKSTKYGRNNITEHELTFTLTYKDEVYGTLSATLKQYGIPMNGIAIVSATATATIPYTGLSVSPSYSVTYTVSYADGNSRTLSTTNESGLCTLSKYQNGVSKTTSKENTTLTDTVTINSSGFTDSKTITFTQASLPITNFEIFTPESKKWNISWEGGTITAFSSDSYKIEVKAIYEDDSYVLVSDEQYFTFTTKSVKANMNTLDKEVEVGNIEFKVTYNGYTSESMQINVVQDKTQLKVYVFTRLLKAVDLGVDLFDRTDDETMFIEIQGYWGTNTYITDGYNFSITSTGSEIKITFGGESQTFTTPIYYDRVRFSFDWRGKGCGGYSGLLRQNKDNINFSKETENYIYSSSLEITMSYFTRLKVYKGELTNVIHDFVGTNKGILDTVTGTFKKFTTTSGANGYLTASQLEFSPDLSQFTPNIIPYDGGNYPDYDGNIMYNIILPKTSSSSSASRTTFSNLKFIQNYNTQYIGENPTTDIRDIGNVTINCHTEEEWGYSYDYDHTYVQQQEAGRLPLNYLNANNLLYASRYSGVGVSSNSTDISNTIYLATYIDFNNFQTIQFTEFALANTDEDNDISRLSKNNVNIYNVDSYFNFDENNHVFTTTMNETTFNYGTTKFNKVSNDYTEQKNIFIFGFANHDTYSNVFLMHDISTYAYNFRYFAKILDGYVKYDGYDYITFIKEKDGDNDVLNIYYADKNGNEYANILKVPNPDNYNIIILPVPCIMQSQYNIIMSPTIKQLINYKTE